MGLTGRRCRRRAARGTAAARRTTATTRRTAGGGEQDGGQPDGVVEFFAVPRQAGERGRRREGNAIWVGNFLTPAYTGGSLVPVRGSIRD